MTSRVFKWAVIGAGPAGIAAVGKLIDLNIKPHDILWIDSCFNVGDLGTLWFNVSSNTTVSKFNEFLYAFLAFNYAAIANHFTLNTLAGHQTCLLKEIVEPLQWITNQLRSQVYSKQTTIKTMKMDREWVLLSECQQLFLAKQVILATGSIPSTLDYPNVINLPFVTAIDKERLAHGIHCDHTYGVFGSSHSAFIIIRNLVELGAKKIINFYRSPHRYAINMGEWTLFDNTGLKGETATWVRNHIHDTLPPSLLRYNLLEHDLPPLLNLCNQVIYAIGFERRDSITIDGFNPRSYDDQTGVIAPNLYGLGIAYPELKADPFGLIEAQVGLWKFMRYLNHVMPAWIKLNK
jgi:cation diffusion facilitator CzcD-associated flavoprotein CzcO